jgi:hydroxymethylglutaryl-CoA lyase
VSSNDSRTQPGSDPGTSPANFVHVVEVGPRDGLQNEATPIPTAAKIAFVNELSAAGLRTVEVTSFVNPAAVPQLADASDVLAGIERKPGVRYLVLVPNERGLDRAIESGADAIAVFAAATEGFSRANLRATLDDAFRRFEAVARRATDRGMYVRGYVSVALTCPFDGPVAPADAVGAARRLFGMGCQEVALADTIGTAGPDQVEALLSHALATMPAERLALHLHDTSGKALANVEVGLAAGIRTFDAAAGGLGGCPFAPGAPGNLSTESLIDYLHQAGYTTGVDAGLVRSAAVRITQLLAPPDTARLSAG